MKKIEIDRVQLLSLLRLGVTKVRIASEMGISKHTLHRYLKKHPIKDDELGVKTVIDNTTEKIVAEKATIIETEPEDNQEFLEKLMGRLDAPKD